MGSSLKLNLSLYLNIANDCYLIEFMFEAEIVLEFEFGLEVEVMPESLFLSVVGAPIMYV